MRLPFHLVVDYAHTKDEIMQRAFLEFFGANVPDEGTEDLAFPLFSEWLIFDFKQPNRSTFLTEYVLKNPDTLHIETIADFTDVVETQVYGIFEIQSVKRPEWIELEDILRRKKMKVYDKTSILTIPDRGILHARVGKVRGKWYFVGSNPTFTGAEFTSRLKKVLRETFTTVSFSPRDTWQMITAPKNLPLPDLNSQMIQKKKEEVEKLYNKLKIKHILKPTFKNILQFIYEEDNASPLDVWKQMTKRGIPEEIFIANTQLFQDIWNLFPHKVLHGKSPAEVYQSFRKLSGEK